MGAYRVEFISAAVGTAGMYHTQCAHGPQQAYGCVAVEGADWSPRKM